MAEYRLGEIEMKFAEIIWRHEPIPSGEPSNPSEMGALGGIIFQIIYNRRCI